MKTLRIALLALLHIPLHLSGDVPKDLVALRETYWKARSQALAPLDKRYAESLTALKARYTRDGNLDAALAADAELKELQKSSNDNAAKAATEKVVTKQNTDVLVGEWEKEGDAAHYVIFRNKEAQHGRDSGTWEVKDGLLTILWSNGYTASITLGQQGNTIEVKSKSPKSTTSSTMVWRKIK